MKTKGRRVHLTDEAVDMILDCLEVGLNLDSRPSPRLKKLADRFKRLKERKPRTKKVRECAGQTLMFTDQPKA